MGAIHMASLSKATAAVAFVASKKASETETDVWKLMRRTTIAITKMKRAMPKKVDEVTWDSLQKLISSGSTITMRSIRDRSENMRGLSKTGWSCRALQTRPQTQSIQSRRSRP